jgi:hypothetical protein
MPSALGRVRAAPINSFENVTLEGIVDSFKK